MGIFGQIIKTIDGGVNWTFQPRVNETHLWSVDFVDENTGWAVGDNGLVLKTSDSGATWIQQESGTHVDLNSVFFVDAQAGWIAGDGRLLKTTSGGETLVDKASSTIPKRFNLHQNYPNPFNPVARIRYDIPRPTHIKIEVYNLQGQKIKVLVDEEKEAGSYEAFFFADQLTSGLYFYQIVTNEFQKVKKMTLIR